MKTIRLSDIVLPAYRDYWRTKKTYVIVKGSRGSGKSKQAALWHVHTMMKLPESNTLVVRKVANTLRDSCYADLQWAIHQLGADDYWKMRTSPLEMEYAPTGQKILFRGMDDGYKTTSIAVSRGVLNFLWIEEFYEIAKKDQFDTLNESIRGVLPDGYFKRVTATFNPWSERHFAKREFFDNPRDNVFTLTTTYKDNKYLSETDLELFEEMKINNPRRYRVAGLGDWGVAEGLIYENWEIDNFNIDELRQSDDVSTVFGLDFGYTNDPTALWCGFISEARKTIWVFDEMYQRGMSNERIAEEVTKKGYAKEKITADAAEPKSIARLSELGIRRIRAAKKGRDSIRAGIDYIQDYHIVVHPVCKNFITEISTYCWDEDKFGNKVNVPVDEYNHLMDAMRYALEDYSRGAAFSFD